MKFVNGSQNDDFLFNVIKLPNNCGEKTLGVITNNYLKFELHIKNMCVS